MKQFFFNREKLILSFGYKYDAKTGEKRFVFMLEKSQAEASLSINNKNEPTSSDEDLPYTKEDAETVEKFVGSVVKEKGLSALDYLNNGLDNRPPWGKLDFWVKIAGIIAAIASLALAIIGLISLIRGLPT